MPLKPLLSAALLATALLAPTLQAEMPRTFKNEYSTRVFGIKVTVTHELTDRKGEGQQLRFEADSWIGNIEEISRFEWNDGVVEPQKYFYKRRGLGRDRDAELTFNWDEQRVINDVQGTSWSMDIHEHVQDKISYQVQLQKDMIAGKENLVYPIADGGELKVYRFEIVAEERLNTPMGPVDTVKVKRSRKDDDRATFAWLAPKWDYLLVRLEQVEDGDAHTLDIDRAQINGEPIKAF